ncbi:MAG TPA: tetratricopeptide repeat protein [Bryobacteraceae bacterium]
MASPEIQRLNVWSISLDNTPEFFNDLGVLHKQHGRLDEAIAAYQQALALNPQFANAHYNLGNAHRAKNNLEPAAESFRLAVKCSVKADPVHGHALAALGQVLAAVGRADNAIPYLQEALTLMPDDPELWYLCGCLENSRKEYVAAIACFQNALRLAPGWAEAQHNLAQALFQLGQVTAAFRLFQSADSELSRAMIAVIIPGVPEAGNQAILEARQAFAEDRVAPSRPRTRVARLRIGYVSSFFQRDNWMKPVWGLINQHDRRLFEIHLFSDAPVSDIRQGYRVHPEDRFHDITGLSVQVVAKQIEDASIDLLIDLNGYSNLRRLPLFTLRPAPVIAGWFNMFATTGMPCYDYLIGDREVIPPEEEKFYCEKIVRVPGSYLTFEVNYPVPDVASPPCLANRTFTFGCLAPQYKITSEVIAAWSRILQRAPESSLLLKNTALVSPGARQFVHGLFRGNGVPPERVRLEGPADHYRFLETYGEIDLALDTFPYNGGTTTTEAIWQGVPVLTFYGDRWASRISASILKAANLSGFVAGNIEGYESLAVKFANCPESLAELRLKMRESLKGSAVCDTPAFARNMENLYRRITTVMGEVPRAARPAS